MRAHRWLAAFVLLAYLGSPPPARAGKIPLEEPQPAPQRSPADRAWKVLLYLPNRAFDLCDVVRLQVRAGPGWAIGARVTRAAPFFLGDYHAYWVGLPGPRGRRSVPLPFGSAGQSGFALGPALAGDSSDSPGYGRGEVGAIAHVYVLGIDVGFDVVELADFFTGFAGVDLSRDDF